MRGFACSVFTSLEWFLGILNYILRDFLSELQLSQDMQQLSRSVQGLFSSRFLAGHCCSCYAAPAAAALVMSSCIPALGILLELWQAGIGPPCSVAFTAIYLILDSRWGTTTAAMLFLLPQLFHTCSWHTIIILISRCRAPMLCDINSNAIIFS